MKRLCSTLLVLVALLFNNSASFGQTTMLAYGPPLVDPMGIAISPDGTTLFIADSCANNAIFRLPVTGGMPTVIASGAPFESIKGITISPDGSTLFVTDTGATGAGPGVIWSLPATGGTPTILASGGPLVNPHGIATSLDGSTLFIADNWFYGAGVYSLPATGGEPILLAAVPSFTNYGRAIDICVSPDGSTLFVAGGFCIYSLPSSGGVLSVIPCTIPLSYATSIALSADGQTLFILDSGGIVSIGPTLIYSLPISGGTPTLLLSGPPLVAGGFLRLSHDDTKLYVTDIGFRDCDSEGPVGEPGRVFVLSVVPSVTQPVYHVDAVNGNDNNNGLSRRTAFATISKGIDSARNGFKVLVYPGVYQEEVDFKGKAITIQGVATKAGIPVIENPGDFAVSFYNGEGPRAILKNFVVRNSFMAIFIAGSSPTLKNLNILGNKYGIEAYAGSEPDISNCIFWENSDSDLFGCEARYSRTSEPGQGNINADPCFVDPNKGDYHLLSQRGRYWPRADVWVLDKVTSPCVDGGDPDDDVLDEPMPNGGRIDMGAYGGTPFASMSETKWLDGDINHDGRVNLVDLAMLAENWLATAERIPFYVPSGMVLISGGEFQMGDSFNEGDPDEQPVHLLKVDSFYMSRYDITNQQYCDYLNSALAQGLIEVNEDGFVYAAPGGNVPYCDTHYLPNERQGHIDYSDGVFSVRTKGNQQGGRDMSGDPMVMVSWYGAAAYCNWRSQQEGKEICYNLSTWTCDFTKHGYRLATEAEWEYAARGGLSGRRFPWGDTISHSQANYQSYWSEGHPYYPYDVSTTEGYHPTWNDGILPFTAPVGSFSANGYGLYDMTGNVWEWCNDWFSATYYSVSPYDNPTGPVSGSYRVTRGGGYGDYASGCRVAFRNEHPLIPNTPYGSFGFRVVLHCH